MSNDYIKNGVNLCRNCQNANTEDCFFACNGSGSYYSPFTAEELYGFGVNNYNAQKYDKAAELWREAADMGHQEAKKALAKLETSSPSTPAPTPSASSARSAPAFQPARQTGGGSSSKGNIVLAILLGLVSAVMLLLTAIMLINNLSALVTLALWAVVFAAGFILFFIAWRNKKTVMIIILAALSIGGMLYAFSRPSSPKPAAAQTANANVNAAATVNANVNFRAEPSTGDNIIRQLQQGDTVTLTGETNGGWTQIQHNGDTGWISTEFLSK